MNDTSISKDYPVWDLTVRLFHWINVLAVLILIAIGVVILNSKTLGVTTDGKILLKTLHVYVGYVFAANLIWRLLWAFVGGRFSRWKAILPLGKGYKQQVKSFRDGLKQGRLVPFLGHNPLARLMVSLLLLLMLVQAVTGLVLAGTDVYMPPFGERIKASVATDSQQTAIIKPYSDEGVDKVKMQEMRANRKPFAIVHYYVFYGLLFAIALHLIGVVVSEKREGGALVSAMITGRKKFGQDPVDLDP